MTEQADTRGGLYARFGAELGAGVYGYGERARIRSLAQYGQPRRFPFPVGRALAIDPKAIDFDWVFSWSPPNSRTQDGIEIVSIEGPLEHKRGFWFDSYEDILDRLEGALTGKAAQARQVWEDYCAAGYTTPDGYQPPPATPASAVVLRWNSPGGEAAGATAAHKRIRALRQEHGIPIYSFADELAASAAYELACGADEIWGCESAVVGSVGVIATAFDRTKENEKLGLHIELITSGAYKADGHPDRKLDDGIRGRIQKRVDALAQIFFQVVAGARGTNVRAVADLEAATFLGDEAVAVGLSDGVAEWPEFLQLVAKSVSTAATEPAALTDDQVTAATAA
jgi:hypothetical protein